ncbi:MAG TPA: glycoside hydrolase family 3 C-terminal domain-containing protein [Dehalococcoidia bacterium]
MQQTGTDIESRIEALLRQLTLEEKLALTAGTDAWHTAAVPRLGIPALKLTDGPHGARGAGLGGVTSACFPCGTALGATWDPDLVREVGAALAQEARSKGARVLLAPTVNIHRHPLAGRNFECFSEDPHLSARMAAAYVAGVQSRGVAATVKHFVCNDSEYQRMTISSQVGERALREIYLAPFEAAVREAGAWAVMAAYNRLNGTYCSEHRDLLLGILKGEWGFDGLAMSDWGGTRSPAAAAAGLDLEMPGPAVHLGAKLHDAVTSGALDEAVIDDKVRRLLRLAARTGALDDPTEPPEQAVDDPAHRELIRRAARDAAVLLHNRGGVLPLDPGGAGLLAVIGPNADRTAVNGGGSAAVAPHRAVSVLEALAARCGPGREVRFEPGCRISRRPPPLEQGLWTEGPQGPLPGATVAYFANPDLRGRPALTQTVRRLELAWMGAAPGGLGGRFSARIEAAFIPQETGLHRLSLASAGKSRLLLNGELVADNWTRQRPGRSFFGRGSAPVEAEVPLTAGQRYRLAVEYQAPEEPGLCGVMAGCLAPEPPDLLERAVALAARAEAAVLVVGLTPEWETEGRDRASMDLPGRQDELIRRVAAVNPRTVVVVNAGSPVSMPWADEVAAVLQAWYPGQEAGDAVADVLFGVTDPGGRLPTTFPVRVEDAPSHLTYPGEAGTVAYGEGVFVGYRGYERRRVTPRFPFGHGLSYTTFAYGPVTLDRNAAGPGEPVTVTVTVRNTGDRPGREVVQVYVRDVESSLLRPEKELKGFAKVALRPGEEREVRIVLPPRAFAAWDPARHDWVAEPGEFEILVGASAADLRGRAVLHLREAAG